MHTIKTIALATFLCLLVLVEGGCVTTKIGVVDPVRLFQDSEPGKIGMNHLKTIEDSMQSQIDLAQGLMEKSPKNEDLRIRFQKVFMDYQQTINIEQQKVVEVVNTLIQKTLDDYRVEKGYNMLMSKDSLLSYSTKDDVTDDIITILNRSTVTFEPVVLEELNIECTIQPITSPAHKGKKKK